MDSLLWACDLAAVAFLCRWALAAARRDELAEKAEKAAPAAQAPPAAQTGRVHRVEKKKPN